MQEYYPKSAIDFLLKRHFFSAKIVVALNQAFKHANHLGEKQFFKIALL